MGCGGSGKTTLAQSISKITNLPVYHLDQYGWDANWRPLPEQCTKKNHDEFIAKNKWIIDGNQIKFLEKRLNKADLIIFIDLNKWHCLYRILRRRLSILAGAKYKITWGFIKYVWSFNALYRPIIMQQIALHQNKKIFIIKNDKDKKKLLYYLTQQFVCQ